MKRISIILVIIMISPIISNAQKKNSGSQKNTLQSEKLDNQGKDLDDQIVSLNKKISELIKKYKLLEVKDISVLPYQTSYNLGKNFIEVEKHTFLRDSIYKRKISGIKTKSIKIFTNGSSISRIESKIYEKNYFSGNVNVVEIVDPSPESGGTDDIEFTHIYRGRTIMSKKKLGDIKNTTAYPVRNEIKQSFLVPHLTTFYNSLYFTVSSYFKSFKDTDTAMFDFLKKSIDY